MRCVFNKDVGVPEGVRTRWNIFKLSKLYVGFGEAELCLMKGLCSSGYVHRFAFMKNGSFVCLARKANDRPIRRFSRVSSNLSKDFTPRESMIKLCDEIMWTEIT